MGSVCLEHLRYYCFVPSEKDLGSVWALSNVKVSLSSWQRAVRQSKRNTQKGKVSTAQCIDCVNSVAFVSVQQSVGW